ncbi:MAG: SH3 domain-containing protein [Desulfobulbaceae bacterium]|nr:SH3 domain-containing protein [Desulfobulbaceae bacterium]
MKFRPVILLGIFTTLVFLRGLALAEMVSIASEDINMRSGPSTQKEVLWKVGTGFPVEIVKSEGEWIQVRDFEGSTGWVKKNTTQKTPHMIVKANKGTNKQIDVRSEPNTTKGKVVARANYGVVFKALEKKSGWVKVEHGQGVTGWVESSQLWGF